MARKRRTLILWSLAAALIVLTALPFGGSMAAPVAQPELTPTPTATRTATATPAPAIDIGNATPIACGQAAGGTTVGAVNNVSVYGCALWLPATGPERVFSLSLQAGSDVDALLGGLTSDLDLFLLTGASPASCIAFGDNAISAWAGGRDLLSGGGWFRRRGRALSTQRVVPPGSHLYAHADCDPNRHAPPRAAASLLASAAAQHGGPAMIVQQPARRGFAVAHAKWYNEGDRHRPERLQLWRLSASPCVC